VLSVPKPQHEKTPGLAGPTESALESTTSRHEESTPSSQRGAQLRIRRKFVAIVLTTDSVLTWSHQVERTAERHRHPAQSHPVTALEPQNVT
jgi:hypothetical protein